MSLSRRLSLALSPLSRGASSQERRVVRAFVDERVAKESLVVVPDASGDFRTRVQDDDGASAQARARVRRGPQDELRGAAHPAPLRDDDHRRGDVRGDVRDDLADGAGRRAAGAGGDLDVDAVVGNAARKERGEELAAERRFGGVEPRGVALGLGLVRPEFAEPPAHAVAARLAERAVGIGVVRTLVKEPRAVGVAVGLADGLDRVEVDGGGRRAAAVVGPLGK